MNNNDKFKNLQSIFNFSNEDVVDIFNLTKAVITNKQLDNWSSKKNEANYVAMKELDLVSFLNGLIIKNRGPQDKIPPTSNQKLTNNIILKKLKIALNLKSNDVKDILSSAEQTLSNHELSAFFRKPGHKNYRPCQDSLLESFFKGLKIKYSTKK